MVNPPEQWHKERGPAWSPLVCNEFKYFVVAGKIAIGVLGFVGGF